MLWPLSLWPLTSEGHLKNCCSNIHIHTCLHECLPHFHILEIFLWKIICLYNSSQKVNNITYEHYQSKHMWCLVCEHLWSYFCRTEPILTGFQYSVQNCIATESKIGVTLAARTSLLLQRSLDDILPLLNSGANLLHFVIKSSFICPGYYLVL